MQQEFPILGCLAFRIWSGLIRRAPPRFGQLSSSHNFSLPIVVGPVLKGFETGYDGMSCL